MQMRPNPAQTGACAPARPRAAIQRSQGAGAPFIWGRGRGPDGLRRVLGPAAGAGGAGGGGRVTKALPPGKTESWSSPAAFLRLYFFIGPVFFYHLSSCPLCFTANTYIPRLRPYFPEQHLKGPKWTAGPRVAARARWWRRNGPDLAGVSGGPEEGTGGRLGAASQPPGRGARTGAAQRGLPDDKDWLGGDL